MKKLSISAFSLVEVTLALGIVSFVMLAVFGLLPVGLKIARNSKDQAAAAYVTGLIANGLRAGATTDGTNYQGGFGNQTINYVLGGPSADMTWNNLTLDGIPETNAPSGQLAAVLSLIPPRSRTEAGRAVISVAWSAQANPAWDAGSQTWTKADGSLTSAIQFIPKP